ncbi:hypothetical protein CPB85DRAFT_1389693 [Mucidula mucida]|nr:hypothetical protein CPB85DRAFT_1389693 [Mucidula mucida]
MRKDSAETSWLTTRFAPSGFSYCTGVHKSTFPAGSLSRSHSYPLPTMRLPVILVPLIYVYFPSVFAFDTHGAAHRHRGARPFDHRRNNDTEKRGNAFDPSQLIDVNGEHAYRPPEKGDLRGPCPGLNALANHGYIDRSGLTTLTEAIDATNQVFNMGIDLGGLLSFSALFVAGDPSSLMWSIGGPPYSEGIVPGVFGPPKGLSGSHNKAESDSSPTRADAYLNNGDATTLDMTLFLQMYNLDPEHTNYDINLLKKFRSLRFNHSVQNNPYFFYSPFTGIFVSQAAYFFIPELFSNHTENGSVLNGNILRSFFGVSDDLRPLRGQERIPDKWYRRPTPYGIPEFQVSLSKLLLENRKYIAVGGNTGTVDSFTPISLGDFTGGVFNAESLLEGNNLSCFIQQAAMSVTPDFAKGSVSDTMVSQYVTSHFAGLGCPELTKWDSSVFGIYPGAD